MILAAYSKNVEVLEIEVTIDPSSRFDPGTAVHGTRGRVSSYSTYRGHREALTVRGSLPVRGLREP